MAQEITIKYQKKIFAANAYMICRYIDSYLIPQIIYTTDVLITLIPEKLQSIRVLWKYFPAQAIFFSVLSPVGTKLAQHLHHFHLCSWKKFTHFHTVLSLL